MKNQNLLLLCLSTIALTACASFEKKPVTDCSAIFEDMKPSSKHESLYGINEEKSKCQVLKIKIQKDVTCEISGSDSTDKLLELYQNENDEERIVLITPIKSINISDLASNYETIYNYYKVLNNIEDHVSSSVFTSLEKFKYKGIKCESSEQKFVGWVGKNQFIASYKSKLIDKKLEKNKAVKHKAKTAKKTN